MAKKTFSSVSLLTVKRDEIQELADQLTAEQGTKLSVADAIYMAVAHFKKTRAEKTAGK